MKKSVFVAVALIALTGCTAHAEYSAPETHQQAYRMYPKTFEIVTDHHDGKLAIDADGNCWGSPKLDEFQLGDFVSTIMMDPDTPDFDGDDTIDQIQYTGWHYMGE